MEAAYRNREHVLAQVMADRSEWERVRGRRVSVTSVVRLLADSRAVGSKRVICLAIKEPELFRHPVQARSFATVLRKRALYLPR